MENQDKIEPKSQKKDFDFYLYQRYAPTIKKLANAYDDNLPLEEIDLKNSEIELALVLTVFPRKPKIIPDSAKRLTHSISEVRETLLAKANTDTLKVRLEQISERGVMDTMDREIKEIRKGPKSSIDNQMVTYFSTIKEIAQLAVVLQEGKV